MPVKVKPMEPKWIQAYAVLSPDLTQAERDEVDKAIKDYSDTSNAAATNLNKKLKDITGIDV